MDRYLCKEVENIHRKIDYSMTEATEGKKWNPMDGVTTPRKR